MRSAATPSKLLLAGLLGLAAFTAAAADFAGKPLPALGGFKFEGQVPDVAGKVVLVDFWASWCAPCKASFPAMAELQRKFADRGLVILAVSVDENAKAYAKFLEKQKPGFATVRDTELRLVAQLEAPTMPTSYLVDRKGVIRFRHEGFHGAASVEAYEKEIAQLLAEPAS